MRIFNFDEFTNEGLWAKGVDRSKTGEERLGDKKTNIEKVCQIVGHKIADKLNIPYNDDICTCIGEERVKNSTEFNYNLRLQFNDETFLVKVPTPPDTEQSVKNICISVLAVFKWGLDYRKDMSLNVRNMLNTIGQQLHDELKHINEGLWAKGIERSQTGDTRREDGKKVMTKLGVEVTLHNTDFDYDGLIEYMLDSPSDDDMGIDIASLSSWEGINNGRKIIAGIKKGEDPYRHLIDGHYVAAFTSYDDIIEYDSYDMDGFDEHDYLEVIKAIVEVLKKGEYSLSRNRTGYDYTCYLVLCDESETHHYECEMNDSTQENWFEWFKEWFEETFEEAELETWSYHNYSASIGVKINYYTVTNYEKMKNAVLEYIKDVVENQEEENNNEEE